MSDERPWRVIVHLSTYAKVEYQIKDERMAREYAVFIMERGTRHVDDRGVETYWPLHMVQKVKVVPPDVVLDQTVQVP